jgi:hypothetical protein
VRLAALSVSAVRRAAPSPAKSRAYSADDLSGSVSGRNSNDDPSEALEIFQSSDVPDVLPAIGAMLFTVVLDGDFKVWPTHVEIRSCLAEFVMDWNLCLRSWQTRLHQDDAQP